MNSLRMVRMVQHLLKINCINGSVCGEQKNGRPQGKLIAKTEIALVISLYYISNANLQRQD